MDKRLTKLESIRRHREMWVKIVEHLEKGDKEINEICGDRDLKRDALVELGYSICEFPFQYCWACEYALNSGYHPFCDKCPLEWPDDKKCNKNGGIYKHFCYLLKLGSIEETIELAKIIRNLPEKKEEKENE